MKSLWLGILLLAGFSARGQHVLFHSPDYTVTGTGVIQGRYRAVAHSDSELTSTYRSPYTIRTRRTVDVKFSINGSDNERVVGQNHTILLPVHGGPCVSPLYAFGEPDSLSAVAQRGANEAPLANDCDLLVRLDMRKVLRALSTADGFVTATGQKIKAADFKGVFLAGSTPPLSWNFSSLPDHPEFRLADPDGDGVYQATIHFAAVQRAQTPDPEERRWKLSGDLSAYPVLRSPFPLVNALYGLSLEEMGQNIRDDGAFMAGAMWPGVWTRDLSYSIILSLAMIHPDASRASLEAKVKDGHIIQDTGTGGSWPVSSDRLVWAIAAWELYKVTGDRDWLSRSFRIIRRSAEEDLHAAYDSSTGLFFGESSFLDWREQTYPRWMSPADIYASRTLGTNAVHYEAFRILAEMADLLGEPAESYRAVAAKVKSAIESRFWLPDRQYYGQYLYGRVHASLSPRSEALGEALTVLFGIPGVTRSAAIIAHTPATRFGIPCIYPQIPDVPPYHNDAVWPFVEAYWAWASARAGNTRSVEQALASVFRATALFLTNKENLVASTGDYMGTEINSSRQLWSVAGSLALVHRVIFGMDFRADSLVLTPCVPRAYEGSYTLHNIRYRKALLDLTVQGSGSRVGSAVLDGVKLPAAVIAGSLEGRHSLVVTLTGPGSPAGTTTAPVAFAPETPVVTLEGSRLRWRRVKNALRYRIVRNGSPVASTNIARFPLGPAREFSEYQVYAVDRAGRESFLSEPVHRLPAGGSLLVQAEQGGAGCGTTIAGFTGAGYIPLPAQGTLSIPVQVEVAGDYRIQFRYANGNGPVNTDNKCAIRTLRLDGARLGVAVFPQRGADVWTDWGYSSALHAWLTRGTHTLMLAFTPEDANMNGIVNTALVDCARLILLQPAGGKREGN